MASFLQIEGSDSISVLLSSVDYGNNTQLNYIFSLSDETKEIIESDVPNMAVTIEEQQQTIDTLVADIIDLKARVKILEKE